MVKKNKNKNKKKDYESIKSISNNSDKDLDDSEEYKSYDSPPDDLSSVLIKFMKKFNVITGLFIFMLYILISTDCFQLHIMRELCSSSYDANIDSITDSGIVFNGVILSLFYMGFDVCYNQN